MIKVQLIHNMGEGSTKWHTVEEGTTLRDFVAEHVPDAEDFQGYIVTVNREREEEYVLKEGDRVVLTPLRIQAGQAA